VGKELYGNYCSSCHGENGDGNGPAARFLYPRPRNFGEGKFRLVSTNNRLPSDADLIHVLTHGMTGSAMFPFAHLPEGERQALVTYVRHLTRTLLEGRVREEAAKNGEEVDPAELADTLDRLTQPGTPLEVPADLPAASAESVARGRAQYAKVCIACHGETGKGDGVQAQRDDNGMPTQPRDFTRGIFKGGRELNQLYARMAVGMPGSPMPASSNLSPGEIGDLINYVLSFSDPAAGAHVEHRRSRLVAARSPEPLGADIGETQWQAVPPTLIVVSPLWWRAYTPPDLQVQALHDGQSLAVRLTWLDETPNDSSVRPQDFEDMAAVQLFKGQREPFLGMGAAGHAVDVWLWRAGSPADTSANLDKMYPNRVTDSYPFAKEKEFFPPRAVGNLRADPDSGLTGGNLQAQGFGSLTMRPKVSQAVKAHGQWKDGRWTVVLMRPLNPGADGGLALSPHDKVSVAFALWDGAAKDRNGQKLVSIWHDLELE
jgi:mono/diheme cytochrome c family protein